MSQDADESSRAGLWARLRFSIIGRLLASPPRRGELEGELQALAQQEWEHPITKEPTCFAVSTIERWYYRARGARDPITVLRQKVRKDAGTQKRLSPELGTRLHRQYQEHPGWTYQLHADNLAIQCAEQPTLGEAPSYSTVRRYLKANGLLRQRGRRPKDTEGARRAATRLAQREVRSFEVAYVHALWHLDFHTGSRRIVLADGRWVTPQLLGVLDDRSRLVCHAQWYLDETASSLIHGLCQALQKRGLPRALMTDNGAAMKSAEFVQGLSRLSILHERTLEYSPYQNAKQEVFWAQTEGRLMAMLEGERELTLELLNEATQAWVELEYHHKQHAETQQTPRERLLQGPSVGRECPGSEELRHLFRVRFTRQQRRSDGTVSVLGRRFEVPSRYRTLPTLVVLAARWDLRSIDLVDPRTDEILCPLYPLDKTKNAEGERRRLAPLGPPEPVAPAPPGIAPLLRKLMADYAATGLPPAYLPKDDARLDRSEPPRPAPGDDDRRAEDDDPTRRSSP
jgi:putative transposase